MALQGNLRKQISFLITQNRSICLSPCFAKVAKAAKAAKSKKNRPVAKRIETVGASIAAKGFLRPHKSYEPPSKVAQKVEEICATLQMPFAVGKTLENLEQKFKLLNACFLSFQHSVPNSQVHDIQTVADIISFYETPVDATVPFDALKKIDLPENLHIQYEYLRFNPDTDTKFGGQTAFPKSSTLVTGLKYRGKYDGHIAKQSWP